VQIKTRNPVFKKHLLLILSLIIIFHLVNNYIWCRNDWITIEDDMKDHLYKHVLLVNDMKLFLPDPPTFIRNAGRLLKGYSSKAYPPLVYFVSASVNLLFHNSGILATRLSNMIYFSVLIISLYLIGKACFGASYGLLAAALVSLYPAIYGFSRLYTLDFPLTCVTALIVFCLIQSGYFIKTRGALFFGLALGLGILIKGQVLIFIVGPFIYVFIKGFAAVIKDRKNILLFLFNVLFALSIAALISSIWWQPYFKDSVESFYIQLTAGYLHKEPPRWIGGLMALRPLSADWFLCYAYFLLNNISPVLFIVFLLGLIFFLRLKIPHKGILLAWLLTPYLIFTIFSVKKDRFFMPAFPAVALISVSLFYAMRKKITRWLLVIAVIAFALIQFFILSYRHDSKDLYWYCEGNSLFNITTPMKDPVIYGFGNNAGSRGFYESICISPRRSNIKSIGLHLLERIDRDSLKKGVFIGFWDRELEPYSLILKYLWKERFPKTEYCLISNGHCNFEEFSLPPKARSLAMPLSRCDYLVCLIKDGNFVSSPKDIRVSDIIPKEYFRAEKDCFSAVGEWLIFPDNYNVLLFKREGI
jgi:hypothetical protein